MKAVALLAWLAATGGAEAGAPRSAPQVVFVCEHGSVKSLIAQEWFNRGARQRGLAVRAVSRGRKPDPGVPKPISEALARDGFDASAFVPQAPRAAELRRAVRVIGIGLDQKALATPVAVEVWEGIPPASEDYAKARDALRARIDVLLSELTGPP